MPVLPLLLMLAAPGATVRGTVADARGGEPLARVRVHLAGTAHAAVTDSGGRFEIAGVGAGEYTLHVSTVGYRLLTRAFSLADGETKEFEVALSPDTFRHTESVEVKAGPFDVARDDSPSERTLSGLETKNLASVLADDPLRSVQAMPGVSSNDDFDARFSLRGAGYERIGVYLDGILLHTPFHTLNQTTSGSMTIFNGDLVEDLGLHPGAWPGRFEDRTGGVLDVHSREGSRSEPHFRITASFSNVQAMGEGPLGKRGSWVAAARKSYLQYLIGRTSTDPSIAFGFTDAQGRIGYDITPRQHATLAYIEGYSDLDRSSARGRLGVNSLMGAGYHFILADLGWRYTPGQSVVVSSTLAYMRERFDNSNRDGLPLGAGYYGEWVWRGAATWAWSARTPLDAGVSVRRLRDDGFQQQILLNPTAVRRLDEYAGHGLRSGGYLQQGWSGWGGRLHGTVGGRWDRHSITGAAALTPQASLGLALGGTRFALGWGQYVQFPELSQLLSRAGSRGLEPERATHYMAAVEQRLGERSRVRAEFYQREDRDLLFRPLYEPRVLASGAIFNPPANPPWRNSVRGYARGVEVFVQRRSANRLTGWASYALSYTKLRDGVTGAVFPADEGQRHTANVYAGYRLRPSVNLSVKWLYGSGFPVPGFFRRDAAGVYFLDSMRNRLRLEPYQRTDVRVNKSWAYDRWKLTLYGEAVNLFNRRNLRFDSFNGYNSRTGQASLTFDKMFPILPSVGLVFER